MIRGTRGLYFCTSTEPFGETGIEGEPITPPDALSHREAGPRPRHVAVRWGAAHGSLVFRGRCAINEKEVLMPYSATLALFEAAPTLRGAQS